MELALKEGFKPPLETLFKDFAHPNPNINQIAISEMVRYWPEESMSRLIENLKHEDIELRRKSIKGLGFFGDLALFPIVKLFLENDDVVIRSSCLKVLVKIAAIEKYCSLPQCLIEVINLSVDDENPHMILLVVLGKLPLLLELYSLDVSLSTLTKFDFLLLDIFYITQ